MIADSVKLFRSKVLILLVSGMNSLNIRNAAILLKINVFRPSQGRHSTWLIYMKWHL